jgi:hydrogenase nickel incorporation protein HypA/HybF
MHEYSVARALLDLVAEHSARHGAPAVRRVVVRVGELSGVEPELLTTAYRHLRKGTPCADAELVIERAALRWLCSRCERDVAAAGALRCGACGSPLRLVQGDELLLDRVEVEVSDVPDLRLR